MLFDVVPVSLIGGVEADADADAGDARACWKLGGAIVEMGLNRAEIRDCCTGGRGEILVALQLFTTGAAGAGPSGAAHCQFVLYLAVRRTHSSRWYVVPLRCFGGRLVTPMENEFQIRCPALRRSDPVSSHLGQVRLPV